MLSKIEVYILLLWDTCLMYSIIYGIVSSYKYLIHDSSVFIFLGDFKVCEKRT